MNKKWILIIVIATIFLAVGMYLIYRMFFSINDRTIKVLSFLRNPDTHQELILPAKLSCGEAPFILPTTGMIGFIWGDSFRPGHKH